MRSVTESETSIMLKEKRMFVVVFLSSALSPIGGILVKDQSCFS